MLTQNLQSSEWPIVSFSLCLSLLHFYIVTFSTTTITLSSYFRSFSLWVFSCLFTRIITINWKFIFSIYSCTVPLPSSCRDSRSEQTQWYRRCLKRQCPCRASWSLEQNRCLPLHLQRNQAGRHIYIHVKTKTATWLHVCMHVWRAWKCTCQKSRSFVVFENRKRHHTDSHSHLTRRQPKDDHLDGKPSFEQGSVW